LPRQIYSQRLRLIFSIFWWCDLAYLFSDEGSHFCKTNLRYLFVPKCSRITRIAMSDVPCRSFYQPVSDYRRPTVRVYRNGINRYLPLKFKFSN
jgi:hypothetical protein